MPKNNYPKMIRKQPKAKGCFLAVELGGVGEAGGDADLTELNNKTQKLNIIGDIETTGDFKTTAYTIRHLANQHIFYNSSGDAAAMSIEHGEYLRMYQHRITDVADPTGVYDATNKQYVDTEITDLTTYLDNKVNKVIFEGPLTGTTPIVIANGDIEVLTRYHALIVGATQANQILQIFMNDTKMVRQDISEEHYTDIWRDVFGLVSPLEAVSFYFYKGQNNKIIISMNREQTIIGDGGFVYGTGHIDAGEDLQIRSSVAASTDYLIIREV